MDTGATATYVPINWIPLLDEYEAFENGDPRQKSVGFAGGDLHLTAGVGQISGNDNVQPVEGLKEALYSISDRLKGRGKRWSFSFFEKTIKNNVS